MTRDPFQCEEEEQQEAVESTIFRFTLDIDTVSNQINDELGPFSGALVSGSDVIYIIGPPHISFSFLHRHKELVSLSSLSLQLIKTKYYIATEHRSPKYHIIQGHIAKGENINRDEGANNLRGIKVYGIPIGTTPFTSDYL